MKRPVSIPDFTKRMNDLFHIRNGHIYLDAMLMAVTGRLEFDILKFDDYLHDLYGEYEDDDKSMSMIITEKYGKEANEFVDLILRRAP